MVRRRTHIKDAALWIVLLVLWWPLAIYAQDKPNILWVTAEDMSPDMGIYGTSQAHTPNLDRLARTGMHFTHAFSTSPVCAPSRSAFMTGMYQTSIGAHHQRLPDSLRHPLPDGVELLTDRLRAADYFTANVVHFPEDVPLRGTGKTDWNFSYDGKPFDSDRWNDLASNQPFFAQINFSESHRGGRWGDPGPADRARVSLPPYYPDHPVTRSDWASYMNAISELDRKVGIVLARLREDGLANNTVVVFFADHGRPMLRGKQWLYDSGLRVPLVVYWPAQMETPTGYEPGSASSELVSLIDVTATTMEVAGVGRPPSMQGHVLFGPKADPPRQFIFAASDRDGEVLLRSRSVRTKEYRYTRNGFPERPLTTSTAYRKEMHPIYHLVEKLHSEGRLSPPQHQLVRARSAEELYYIPGDPYEIHNVVSAPIHRGKLSELRTALDRWIERTGDQGQHPDPPAVVKYFVQYGEQSARQRASRIEQTKQQVHRADEEYLQLIGSGSAAGEKQP